MERIPTALGRLAVEVVGDGAPAVLWHSFFVDSRTWKRVMPALAEDRTLIVIDAPGFGESDPLTAEESLQADASAAMEVLQHLGMEQVDWVGNAWGGHVGIVLGAMRPDMLRSLVSIGAPVHAFGAHGGPERPMLAFFRPILRMVGFWGPLGRLMASFLLNKRTMRDDEEAVRIVVTGMRRPGRRSFDRSLRCGPFGRKDITAEALSLPMPVLFAAGDDRGEWTPAEAKAVTDRMPDARTVTLPGVRAIAPLEDPEAVIDLVRRFWRGAAPISPAGDALGAA